MLEEQSLTEEDRRLLQQIGSGSAVSNLQSSSKKYRELATGILLQYADSEMSGAAGYAQVLPCAPGLKERVALARIMHEKLSLAQRTYDLAAQTGISIDKYVSSHCWESRLQRKVALGYRRGAADKRVNALMYPMEGWADLCVFTYLMASMACLQLDDFRKSSFEPWANLAAEHLPVEESHREFGLDSLRALSASEPDLGLLRLSLRYWFDKVKACFGPPHSERNALYLEFGIKTRRNEELADAWQAEVSANLASVDIAAAKN